MKTKWRKPSEWWWSMEENVGCAACGGVLGSSPGVITSPNYPSDYDHNDFCSWIISAPVGQRVRVSPQHGLEQHRSLYDCKTLIWASYKKINSLNIVILQSLKHSPNQHLFSWKQIDHFSCLFNGHDGQVSRCRLIWQHTWKVSVVCSHVKLTSCLTHPWQLFFFFFRTSMIFVRILIQ